MCIRDRALLLAVPVALGIAIYLAELAPVWLRRPLGFLVELLAETATAAAKRR